MAVQQHDLCRRKNGTKVDYSQGGGPSKGSTGSPSSSSQGADTSSVKMSRKSMPSVETKRGNGEEKAMCNEDVQRTGGRLTISPLRLLFSWL